MHNLHLVRIKADSPEEACKDVELEIEDFGNENNWRSIGGCIDKDGNTFVNDNISRWTPEDKDYNTIEKLNKLFTETKQGTYLKTRFDEAMAKPENERDSMDWYSIQKYGHFMSETCGLPEKIDVLEDNFFDWQFDEFGITDLGRQGKKTYIVFVDMHS